MSIRKLILTLMLGAVLCPLWAQNASNSQNMKILDLKRSKLELDSRKSSYERARKLQAEGLIAEQEYILARTEFLKAQVAFQEALIRFVGDEVRISVAHAVKTQTASGEKVVQVSLLYTAREIQELGRMGLVGDDAFPMDFLKEARNISVSLQEVGRIISNPYEVAIPVLPVGKPVSVSFRLLKDVEAVDVCVRHSGQSEVTPVQLQKGVSANSVTIASAQFSQEADLEGTATYDLSLEKFSGEGDTFRLELLNLPDTVTAGFIDPQTQARLSQIKFTPGTTTMRLGLRLQLPKNPDSRLVLDTPLTFYALVLDESQYATWRALQTRTDLSPAERLEQLKAGKVNLELIPRGRGRLELQALNLYHEASRGRTVQADIKVRNSGTRRLDNVLLTLEMPLNWRSNIRPVRIPVLEQDQEAVVSLTFQPPPDVLPGDYEPRLRASSKTGGTSVESEEKVFRIRIQEKSNPFLIGGVAGGVLLTLGALVWLAIRLTRR